MIRVGILWLPERYWHMRTRARGTRFQSLLEEYIPMQAIQEAINGRSIFERRTKNEKDNRSCANCLEHSGCSYSKIVRGRCYRYTPDPDCCDVIGYVETG